MKTFLKIILLLVFLAALTSVTAYSLYRDVLFEKIRVRFEHELSDRFDHTIQIGKIEYVPFRSFSIKGLVLSPLKKTRPIIAKVENAVITVDLFASLKNRGLITRVKVKNLYLSDVLGTSIIVSGTMRTASNAAGSYKKIFDNTLLNSISITDGYMKVDDYVFKNISGSLKIDNMIISGGNFYFSQNRKEYSIDFSTLNGEDHGYDITLHSKNLNFQSTFVQVDEDLRINTLNGTFYSLNFDLSGETSDYLSKDPTLSLNGTIRTDLKTFTALPGKIGPFVRDHRISGDLHSQVYFTTKALKIDKYNIDITISGTDLQAGDFHINKITANLALHNGRISSPLINGKFYKGIFDCDLKLDLMEEGFPYTASMEIKNMNFEQFMQDVTKKKVDVYGTLGAKLDIRGLAENDASIRGIGQIDIQNADLGPMPILTPLLGSIFLGIQSLVPGMNRVIISEAFTDFVVKNRRVITNNLTLMGEDIAITAQGNIDFDGNLDLTIENQFREPDQKKDEDWRTMIRNAIIHFGKLISKTHLRGTLKKPKWGLI